MSMTAVVATGCVIRFLSGPKNTATRAQLTSFGPHPDLLRPPERMPFRMTTGPTDSASGSGRP